MDEGLSPYFALIQRCEAAIVRIRAARRAGTSHTDAVGDEYQLIRQAVTPRFTSYATRIAAYAPEAADEALDAMFDQLFDDVWSLTYVSLETQFGAYLNSMPKRILQKIRRKHVRDDASFIVERLDALGVDDGTSLHDTAADPHAQTAFAHIAEREALADAIQHLPPAERHVIQLRLQGYENNAIAHQFGVSASTASRIYTNAVALLQQRLGVGEE